MSGDTVSRRKAEQPKQSRWYDPTFKMMSVQVQPGEHYVSTNGHEMIVTVLGSCVAACVWDPRLRIGGMNHFLLPDAGVEDLPVDKSMRYGTYAMEVLINDLLRRGARRHELEIKVFGGGNVLFGVSGGSGGPIGDRNAEFVRRYLNDEGLRLHAEDLGGQRPRRVHFFPREGKVMRVFLKKDGDRSLLSRERLYRSHLNEGPVEGESELFT